jgi:hypothetical protein
MHLSTDKYFDDGLTFVEVCRGIRRMLEEESGFGGQIQRGSGFQTGGDMCGRNSLITVENASTSSGQTTSRLEMNWETASMQFNESIKRINVIDVMRWRSIFGIRIS